MFLYCHRGVYTWILNFQWGTDKTPNMASALWWPLMPIPLPRAWRGSFWQQVLFSMCQALSETFRTRCAKVRKLITLAFQRIKQIKWVSSKMVQGNDVSRTDIGSQAAFRFLSIIPHVIGILRLHHPHRYRGPRNKSWLHSEAKAYTWSEHSVRDVCILASTHSFCTEPNSIDVWAWGNWDMRASEIHRTGFPSYWNGGQQSQL